MIMIRKFRPADAEQAGNIISSTFLKYNAKNATKEAAKRYTDAFLIPEKREKRFSKKQTPYFFVAVDKDQVVGLIRGSKERLINFYVLDVYQGKGIGKKLFLRYEKALKESGADEIKVRSSLFAVPIYTRFGFKKTTGIRSFRGIKTQPMKKTL
jgi:GNAT superfamily N-acetyltransferase